MNITKFTRTTRPKREGSGKGTVYIKSYAGILIFYGFDFKDDLFDHEIEVIDKDTVTYKLTRKKATGWSGIK